MSRIRSSTGVDGTGPAHEALLADSVQCSRVPFPLIHFLRAVREGKVTATSTPLHKGQGFVVVETELRDDQDRLVAKVTQTHAVL
jgi:uncharacterized protein (TIGR00369 family)